MIDRVGEPNVFAHLDTFHMNVEEKGFRDPDMTRLAALWRDVALSPDESLRECLPFLRARAREHRLSLGRVTAAQQRTQP